MSRATLLGSGQGQDDFFPMRPAGTAALPVDGTHFVPGYAVEPAPQPKQLGDGADRRSQQNAPQPCQAQWRPASFRGCRCRGRTGWA